MFPKDIPRPSLGANPPRPSGQAPAMLELHRTTAVEIFLGAVTAAITSLREGSEKRARG